MDGIFNKKRLIKNSATLYVRMMFTMALNLLATRFTLAALGVDDMGVYGVVGSIVGMFTFLVSGLLSAMQRFVTFELGKSNGDIGRVFSTSVNLILLMSFGLLLVLEVGGNLMLAYSVRIPEVSVEAARWVLQFSIFTCMLNICSTPYSALLVAHERMDAWAVISVVQVALNCAAAYSLTQFANSQRLFLYALFMLSIQLLVQALYIAYAKRNFPETRHCWRIDRTLTREMARFAGANMVGSILQMIHSQGIILIINWTFGVAVNAVFNIGMQVKNSVLSFGMNIFKSISPQITKTYAAGEMEAHKKLVYGGSKVGVFMILFIFIPFVVRSHYIMHLWLGNVPYYASMFAVALIFQSLLYAGFEPFKTAVLATGHVGHFFIFSEVFHLFVLPLGYVGARYTTTPLLFVIIVVIWEVLYCAYMVYLGTRVSELSVRELWSCVCIPCVVTAVPAFILVFALARLMPQTFLGLVCVCLLSSIVLIGCIYVFGLNRHEHELLKHAYAVLMKRIKGKRNNYQ